VKASQKREEKERISPRMEHGLNTDQEAYCLFPCSIRGYKSSIPFIFVGSTICYALMQATGMVNDHLVDYFRHSQVKKLG
jgi:3-methyladenine DNA glycosylase Tag